MKNLKKYTKAELISKINGLNKNNSSNLFSKIIGFFLLFKNFMLKITLIAIIIKIFKKYSIFRRLWTIFNTILLTIFGISFIDMFQIEILSNLLHNILDLFSKFQENLLELFSPKVDLPTKSESLRTIQQTTTRIQDGNDESNKIIERFKQIINKKEEIEPEIIKEEIKEENNPFYKNKYVIIAGIFLLLGLSWYYWEDINSIKDDLVEKFTSFRRKPGSNPGNIRDDLQPYSPWNIKESIKGWWNKGKLDKDAPGNDFASPFNSNTPISLKSNDRPNLLDHYLPDRNKGKATDLAELSETEINRRILKEITGEKEIRFDMESNMVLQQLTHFMDKGEDFPNNDLKIGMYNMIRAKLLALSSLSPMLYENFIKDDNINKEIEKFLNLEDKINPDDNQSDTYNEVAKATIEEQDVWSDRGSSPRAFSPKQELILDENKTEDPNSRFSSLFDQINKLRNEEEVVDNSRIENKSEINLLTNLIQEANNFDDADILTAVRETLDEDLNTRANLITNSPQQVVENPKIQINDDSDSNNSMNTYFTNPNKSPILSQINIKTDDFIEGSSKNKLPVDLLSQINSKRLEYGTPIVGNIGLQNPIQERVTPAPLINKPSFSNLLEDSLNLFDDNPLDMAIDTSLEPANKEVLVNPLDIIDSFDKVKVVIDRSNHQLNFNFGEMKNQIKKIHTATNDGYLASFDLTDDNTYPWDTRDNKNYNLGTRIKEILITDINGNNITIYSDKENIPEEVKLKDFVEGSSNDTQQVEIDDPWLKVEINYEKGDIYKRFININLDSVKDQTNKVLIITNDGRSQYFKPMFKNNSSHIEIKWDNLGLTNPYHNELDIQNVYLIDKNNHNHNIFYNKNVKILDSFFENIKK